MGFEHAAYAGGRNLCREEPRWVLASLASQVRQRKGQRGSFGFLQKKDLKFVRGKLAEGKAEKQQVQVKENDNFLAAY